VRELWHGNETHCGRREPEASRLKYDHRGAQAH
jgi:hypothetical protein